MCDDELALLTREWTKIWVKRGISGGYSGRMGRQVLRNTAALRGDKHTQSTYEAHHELVEHLLVEIASYLVNHQLPRFQRGRLLATYSGLDNRPYHLNWIEIRAVWWPTWKHQTAGSQEPSCGRCGMSTRPVLHKHSLIFPIPIFHRLDHLRLNM
jgi:hypothetical protein